jgi:hypothetical protein
MRLLHPQNAEAVEYPQRHRYHDMLNENTSKTYATMLRYAPNRLLNPLYLMEPTMPYTMRALLRLRRLFSSFPLPLSLRVYLRRERTAHAHMSARLLTQNQKRKKGNNSLLIRPGDRIRGRDQPRQHQPRRLPAPQRGAQEAERAAVVHGRRRDVEREAGHRRVHQDPEVVAQVRAGQPQRPHGREHEDVAAEEEAVGR